MVERNLPNIGNASTGDLRQTAQAAREALAQLGTGIQWVESYICGDKTFCLYLAEDEELVRRQSEITGMPIHGIREVVRIIDPATANAVARLRA
jgi:hypothetical protein